MYPLNITSQAFYRLLTVAMKDWELRRKRLNEMVEVRFVHIPVKYRRLF
jgi:hypothetical protein